MSIGATWKDVLDGHAQWSYENRDGLVLVREHLRPGTVDHGIGDPPYDEKTHEGARSLRDGGSDIAIDFDPLPPCETFVPHLLVTVRRWILQFCTQEMARDYQVGSGDDKYQRARTGTENYIRAQWWVRTNGAPQISGDRAAVPGETIATLHSHRWEKKRWNGGGDRGYYTGPICDQAERLGHPTQKPDWLMRALIAKHTDPGESILDWCGGVATTGAAALALNRRFIGCELRGPCAACGGDIPHDWPADLRRRVLSLDPNLKPCPHGRVNYHAIGRARLAHVERSLKQRVLIAV